MEARGERSEADDCPPRERWPAVASMKNWSAKPGEETWKVIRKCPHCGKLREEVESEPA